ncbi:hypothetical protein [Streptomyces sp. SHP 1-2]|uniref:hypothetical protein n=1 Tax=Streptomyces sp. SHP 1-2 TaxID=2769489 RepID=UPI002237888F|nr:hypothetical protein [Streptomyces sp. SHP 1-2]MCW5249473.1 hypothetical protein [Streptomyces sp. SHP 1-2]
MTTADGWARAVRERVGLGRLLPLGGVGDGAWITERAARKVLLGAVSAVPGTRVEGLRIGPDGSGGELRPVVPPPPSALPPGPLRVTADFAAVADGPLPSTAGRLRAALAGAAHGLGLEVTEVDLRAVGLLEAHPVPGSGTAHGSGERGEHGGPGASDGTGRTSGTDGTGRTGGADGSGGPVAPAAPRTPGAGQPAPAGAPAPAPATGAPEPPRPAPAGEPAGSLADRAGAAALAVPGVSRLTSVLGRPAQVAEHHSTGAAATLPRPHVRVELAVRGGRCAAEVARRVRGAVADALPDHPTVAVLVTAVD